MIACRIVCFDTGLLLCGCAYLLPRGDSERGSSS